MSPLNHHSLISFPAPLVPPNCDLRILPSMPLDVKRLRASDMQMEVTPEEGWFALQLWGASWHQVPSSSLPNDDDKLAYFAGLPSRKRIWNRVKSGAMRGFILCSDGKFYHPVIAKISLKAWKSLQGFRNGAAKTNGQKNGHHFEIPEISDNALDTRNHQVEDTYF